MIPPRRLELKKDRPDPQAVQNSHRQEAEKVNIDGLRLYIL